MRRRFRILFGFMSMGAALVVTGVLATSGPALIAAPGALSACGPGAQWNIAGTWHTSQSNTYTAVWKFKQSDTALTADVILPMAQATAQGMTGNVGHLVKGTLVGNKLDVTVQWPVLKSGTILRGRYVGTVEAGERPGQGKVVHGEAWNVASPGNKAIWTGHGDATCASWPPLPEALVDNIEEVSNGCGPGEPSPEPSRYDTVSFVEQTVRYTVDFREACNLHDAGYSGAKVRDSINGGIVDFFNKTRAWVDDKFEKDMHTLCNRQVGAQATLRHTPEDEKEAVLRRCTTVSAAAYHELVRLFGGIAAWEERPNLIGLWTDAQNVDWHVFQTDRTVKASWQNPDTGLRGQFRGTLISYHHKSIVDGVARITEAGKTVQDDMTMWFYPAHPNQLDVKGPGVKGMITRQ